MFDRFMHTLMLGLRSLAAHRLRSFLTALGIVLGVASVIVMLAVGEAARFEAVRQLQELGATTIIVRSVKPDEEKERTRGADVLTYGLTMADLDRILATTPSVVGAVPAREARREVRSLQNKFEGRIVAIKPSYFTQNGLRLSHGRLLTDTDDRRLENVAVLAAGTADKLFPVSDPIGKSIQIAGHAYRVVGVTEAKAPTAGAAGSLQAQDYNLDVYIPFLADQARNGSIILTVKSSSYQIEKLEVSQLTLSIDSVDHVRQTAGIVEGLLNQYHPQKDTEITVPLELLERAEKTQRIFTLVLGAIAGISLVVGGIGIMNIMLAAVTERTREIGVRRALGAKRRDIARQFLIETVLLSTTGGLLGVLLGIGISHAVTRYFELPTIIRAWSPMVALGVSLLVGIVFGTYPARRAAQMDPIEALRHE
jgi:putative ABC transport system permease protein